MLECAIRTQWVGKDTTTRAVCTSKTETRNFTSKTLTEDKNYAYAILVHTGAYWCILVHIVHTGTCICIRTELKTVIHCALIHLESARRDERH